MSPFSQFATRLICLYQSRLDDWGGRARRLLALSPSKREKERKRKDRLVQPGQDQISSMKAVLNKIISWRWHVRSLAGTPLRHPTGRPLTLLASTQAAAAEEKYLDNQPP